MSSYTVSHQVGARCSRLVCGRVFAGLPRLMWHGGHFCQIQCPGTCCDVKGTVKRQPQGSAGTAALSALFPLRHRLGHTHRHKHRELTHGGGKDPRGESPRIFSKQTLPPNS